MPSMEVREEHRKLVWACSHCFPSGGTTRRAAGRR